jgi:hypothetical protein
VNIKEIPKLIGDYKIVQSGSVIIRKNPKLVDMYSLHFYFVRVLGLVKVKFYKV